MKKEWVKPEIKFITDPDIILGCLYEVYGQERKSVFSGCWQITHREMSGIWRLCISGSGRSMKKNRKNRCLYSRARKFWRLSGKEKMVDDFL